MDTIRFLLCFFSESGGWYCFNRENCNTRYETMRRLMSSKEWPTTRTGKFFILTNLGFTLLIIYCFYFLCFILLECLPAPLSQNHDSSDAAFHNAILNQTEETLHGAVATVEKVQPCALALLTYLHLRKDCGTELSLQI